MQLSFILEDAFMVGIPIFMACYGVSCLLEKKRLPLLTVRQAALLLFCLYIGAVSSLTGLIGFLDIRNPDLHLTNPFSGFDLTPFRGHVFKPILQNLFLLMPLGFLISSVTPKIKWNIGKIFLLGFGVSLTIEILQGFISRQQEIDDLIMNTAGACAGYLFFAAVFRKGLKLWQRVLIIAATLIGLYYGMLYIKSICWL